MDYLDLIDIGGIDYYEYIWKYNKNNGECTSNK